MNMPLLLYANTYSCLDTYASLIPTFSFFRWIIRRTSRSQRTSPTQPEAQWKFQPNQAAMLRTIYWKRLVFILVCVMHILLQPNITEPANELDADNAGNDQDMEQAYDQNSGPISAALAEKANFGSLSFFFHAHLYF